MASPSSTRDLMKAANAFISSPNLPLPEDLLNVIEGYLNKHEEYDQSASDRLQEDLLSTYFKSVENQPILYYTSFLAIVRRLRPAIRSPAHVVQWWEKLAEPVLGQLGQDRGSREKVLKDVDKLLVYDEQDEDGEECGGHENPDAPPHPIMLRVMQKWMDACHSLQSSEDFNGEWVRDAPIHDVVLVLGRKRPMDFFNTLNTFFVQKDYRIRSIILLMEFVRSQPPHIHLVIKSPFFDSLVRCLQLDTSTTVISLALTSLTMLLPNMPGSIVPVLPALFNIYTRILFWDREPQVPEEGQAEGNPPEQHASDQLWERCTYAAENDDASVPQFQLMGYYTILYGLYPLNFMDYIRKPQRYLRHANMTDADEVEVQPSEMRDRSEQFRQCHLLHPNFYSLTIESEKTDFGRWRRSATADIVAECVGLRIPMDHMHDQPRIADDMLCHPKVAAAQASPAAGQQEETIASVLSPSLNGRGQPNIGRRGSLSSFLSDSHAPESGSDSPTLPPLLSQSLSRTDLQGMIDSNKAIKSRLYQSHRNDSVPSLSLSIQDTIHDKPVVHLPIISSLSPLQVTDSSGNGDNSSTTAQLRRQILLLNNDLSFERYMVQQHLSHIGALRRSNMKQVVTEAETQNLILINRTLKNRLDEAKKTEAQVKKEAEMSRNRAKSWEESLANRVKKLREEHKKWSAEEAGLRADLKSSQDECQRLMWLVCEKEVRELKLEQAMQVLEAGEAERDRLNERVKQLAAVEKEGRQLKEQLRKAQDEASAAGNKVELLQMKLEAREREYRQTHDYYEQQVATLSGRLAEAQRDGPAVAEAGTGSSGSLAETRMLVESALAASRAKNLELQKNHSRLTRQYKILESKMLDRATMYESQDHGVNIPRILSEPDPEPVSGSSVGSGPGAQRYGQRLASDAGSAEANTGTVGPHWDTAETPTGTTPQVERYYGRGGVQNASRKDRKEKKRDETDKRDKRSTGSGIRGIRGFV